MGFTTHDGPPAPISGIGTPNPQTIVFHLTEPTGDFLLRLAMPAAGPIPEKVAGCFDEHGEYGRYLVSSGPYMIRGADEVDASSCETLTPTAGWSPGGYLELVRNPSYDPNTDSPEVRENLIDGVQVSIGMDPHEIFQRIQDGELDGSLVGNPPQDVVDEYLTDPDLAGLLHADPTDGGFYITMNLLVPPFDDVNVRRAVNLVMDKSAMQDAWGGETYGDIATNVFPPAVLPETAGYDPYPNHGGNLVLAKAEMALSAYDTDGDGLCEDPACQGVRMVTRDDGPFPAMATVIAGSLAEIGIDLDVQQMDMGSAFNEIFDVSNFVPIAANPSWYKDYPDPYTFARFLFDSDWINCEPGAMTLNYALVGMTGAQATECGVPDEWSHAQPPSVDADIDACQVLEGDGRSACWADLNHTLMQDVVPWVPFKWDRAITVLGEGVTHYEFDQFGSMISLVHISLQVPFSYLGFFAPVDNPGTGTSPVYNVMKAGAAVPVKFSLGGDEGLDVITNSTQGQVQCDSSASLDGIEQTVAAGGSSLSYDPATKTYTYVWKTDKAWSTSLSKCRLFNMELSDGTHHVAYFKFVK